MDHDWDYSPSPVPTLTRRDCRRCPVQQLLVTVPYVSELAPGRQYWCWRRRTGSPRWRSGQAPACYDPAAADPDVAWVRLDDEKRWVIDDPHGGVLGHQYSDEAIRTFGRKHSEWILEDLPALPEKAWDVLRRPDRHESDE